MKKSMYVCCVFCALFLIYLLPSCASLGKKGVSAGDYYDIYWESHLNYQSQLFRQIKKIVGDNPVAVYAINHGEYSAEDSLFYEQEAVKSGIKIATRRPDVFGQEFEFQFGGNVADEEIREIGRMRGVNHVLRIETELYKPEALIYENYNDFSTYNLYEIQDGLLLFSGNDSFKNRVLEINKKYYIEEDISNQEQEQSYIDIFEMSKPPYDQLQICQAFKENAIRYFQSYKYFCIFNYLSYEQEDQDYDWSLSIEQWNNGMYAVVLSMPNGYYRLAFSDEMLNDDFMEIGDFSRNSPQRKEISSMVNSNLDKLFARMEQALKLNNDNFSQKSKEAIKAAYIR
jgi:hypothetical protein